jgi:phosphatidylglycerol---prolipoprotein diacylglyceryl transferase
MFPTLFEIGPFTVQSLWTTVIIGLLVGTMMLLKNAKHARMDVNFILEHSTSLLIGTVSISRLTFFLANWGFFGPLSLKTFLQQVFFFWEPGLSFWGATLGFTLVFIYHCKREKENPLEWLEIAIIPLFTAMFIGNFGQLLDGQGYGKDTILPWGITFESTTVKYTVPIHPTQIYSMIIIATIVLTRKKICAKWEFLKQDHHWAIFAISSYSLARFLLEFLRGDDTLQIGMIRLGHVISLIIFVPTAYILYKKAKEA